jgi:ribosomal protein S18 acetylase RimI-like enzyme
MRLAGPSLLDMQMADMKMVPGKSASAGNRAEWGAAESGRVASPDEAAGFSTATGTDRRLGNPGLGNPRLGNPGLGNPIWHAALTRQQHLAYGAGPALRFYPEVVPLAAIKNHSPEAVAALTTLVYPGERVWLFEEPPPLNPAEWRESRRIPGYQMLCSALAPQPAAAKPPSLLPASLMLDPVADAPAMEALKAIAFPGFFGPRTPQMGRYRGIHVDGQLVAMAGERLALLDENGRGWREVSAVCTHPEHRGHGYAERLTREATAAILADGDTPVLHVADGNDRALSVYRRLGYTHPSDVVFVELTRLG